MTKNTSGMSEKNNQDELIKELIEKRQSEIDAFKKLLDGLSKGSLKVKKKDKKKTNNRTTK